LKKIRKNNSQKKLKKSQMMKIKKKKRRNSSTKKKIKNLRLKKPRLSRIMKSLLHPVITNKNNNLPRTATHLVG
jgi:hypothetical protein